MERQKPFEITPKKAPERVLFYLASKLFSNELKYVISNVVDKLLSENVIQENITRSQMESALEDLLKSKDFEKKVNHIVIDTLGDFLENMWTKKSFWKTMMKKK